MIDPQQADGRVEVEVVKVQHVFRDVDPEFVAYTECDSARHARTGERR